MDNMAKLVADSLRTARNEKLEKSDIDLLKALEVGDTVAVSELHNYRQSLRDLPELVDDPWTDESVVPAMPLSPSEQAMLEEASASES